jgi:hypothetical protein
MCLLALEERKLEESRNKVLEKIFTPKKDEIVNNLGQVCTNPWHHISMVTKLFTLAPNIRRSSV